MKAVAARFQCSKSLLIKRLRQAGVLRVAFPDSYPGVLADEVARERQRGLTFPQLVLRFECGAPALIRKGLPRRIVIVRWCEDEPLSPHLAG